MTGVLSFYGLSQAALSVCVCMLICLFMKWAEQFGCDYWPSCQRPRWPLERRPPRPSQKRQSCQQGCHPECFEKMVSNHKKEWNIIERTNCSFPFCKCAIAFLKGYRKSTISSRQNVYPNRSAKCLKKEFLKQKLGCSHSESAIQTPHCQLNL